MMIHTVFIDGEAGTTGLKIRERLQGRDEIKVIELSKKNRKIIEARAEALNSVDVAILCLPEEVSKEAVSLIENCNVRVIDASVAYRTHSDWVYGFPEYERGHREKIINANRVSNPGCYACGAISILHPLIKSGLILKDDPVTINAVSGYTGGGKKLISEFQNTNLASNGNKAFYHYALNLEHKHTEEIRQHSGLTRRPIFVPSVGRFAQGMIVSVPLQLWALSGKPKPGDIYNVLSDYYAGQRFVVVVDKENTTKRFDNLDPEALNNTNQLKLYVFENEGHEQAVVVAVLDNLGKGASGQAVQCLNLMLGLNEEKGLQ